MIFSVCMCGGIRVNNPICRRKKERRNDECEGAKFSLDFQIQSYLCDALCCEHELILKYPIIAATSVTELRYA
jgi:hypothetical protein